MAGAESRGSFKVVEAPEVDPAAMLKVLRGEIACVLFRGHDSTGAAETLLRRFLQHPRTRVRTGDATGYYLGAFHWGKTREEYFRESEGAYDAAQELLISGGSSGWSRFEECLRSALAEEGTILRRAAWNGAPVVSPIIRAWMGTGQFSLVPHEDLAQCSDPRQEDFEIQKMRSRVVCSANFCIGNENGGELVMWDWSPSDEDRSLYDTKYTGGPYSLDCLGAYQKLVIPVRPGDLYIFNGGFVHAVAATGGERATVSSLLGYVDDKEVVMWT